jgi:Cu-Zn family superoxide dismutase
MRRTAIAFASVIALASVGAIGAFLATAAAGAAGSAGGNLPAVKVQARFATPASYRANPKGTAAVTYDPAAVPIGSSIRVKQSANEWGGMDVQLNLEGLRPHASYKAYVDIGRCTADPTSPGRHFENSPSSGSYPANEFSFNFETDGDGNASALTQQYWGITKYQHANSVVILRSGVSRLAACVTVPFRRLNPGW